MNHRDIWRQLYLDPNLSLRLGTIIIQNQPKQKQTNVYLCLYNYKLKKLFLNIVKYHQVSIMDFDKSRP